MSRRADAMRHENERIKRESEARLQRKREKVRQRMPRAGHVERSKTGPACHTPVAHPTWLHPAWTNHLPPRRHRSTGRSDHRREARGKPDYTEAGPKIRTTDRRSDSR